MLCFLVLPIFKKFVDWFLSNKSPVLRDTMLCSVRQECGLSCPPEPFTTNSSESINALLKQKVNYKKSELPDFIDIIKQVIDEQQREVERAIIRRGKYKLRAQYSILEVRSKVVCDDCATMTETYIGF